MSEHTPNNQERNQADFEIEDKNQNISNRAKRISNQINQFKRYRNALRRARAEGYEIALKDVASGKALEEINAETYLQKGDTIKNKISNFFRRNSLNINTFLTFVVAIFVAVSGIYFSLYQAKINERSIETEDKKRKFDLRVSKTNALSELIPSLTSENAQTRGFAYSALFALEDDKAELEKIAERFINPVDAEILEDLIKRLEDMGQDAAKIEQQRKNLAELYARRAESNLQNWELETDWNKKKSILENSKNDIKKAFDKNPQNARAEYLNAVLLRDEENDKKAAVKGFKKVIELLKDDKNRDDDMYLLSFLNLAVLYNFTEDKDLDKYCKNAVEKYNEKNWQINDTEFKEICRQSKSEIVLSHLGLK